MTDEEIRLLGQQDPYETYTDDVDPIAQELPMQLPVDPIAGLRSRLAERSAAESLAQGATNAMDRIIGTKSTPVDFGSGMARDELAQGLKERLLAKKSPTGTQSEKFSQYYVREGEHKGKPIYYTPGKGMFIRDGNKIIDEVSDSKIFANPYKPMVEKGEYQRKLDQDKLGLATYTAKRASDKQIKAVSDTKELFQTIGRIRELKPGVNTGPIANKYQTAKGYVSDKSPEYARLEGITGKSLAEFLKSISGAAISEKEAERLTKVVPHTGMNDEEFNIKLDEFERGIKRGIKSFIDTNEAAGKNMKDIKAQMIEAGLYETKPETKKKITKDIKKDNPVTQDKQSQAEEKAKRILEDPNAPTALKAKAKSFLGIK